MPEDTKLEETTPPEDTSIPKPRTPEAVFHIHNTARDVATKATRVGAARQGKRLTLLLAGGDLRIPRGRFVAVRESVIRRLHSDLVQKEKEGNIKVTLPGGEQVDLATLQPIAPLPVSAPLPHPRPDSAAHDKTFEHGVGEAMPNLPGGKAPGRAKVPSVLEGQELEQESAEGGDMGALADAVYASGSFKELATEARKRGIDTGGNKRDLAERLAAAGYLPPER